jgi:hypothetical protein
MQRSAVQVRETLTGFGGIRMAPTISRRASANHRWRPYGSSVSVGDLNGDGKPDVVVTNHCGTGKNCDDPGSGRVTFALFMSRQIIRTSSTLYTRTPSLPGQG